MAEEVEVIHANRTLEPRFTMRDGETRLRLGAVDSLGIDLTMEEARGLRYFLNENKEKLRPSKDWRNCPYEGHSDDCDCKGMGGDR